MSEPKETKGRGRPATGVTPAHKLTCPDDLWQKMIMVAAGGGSSLSAETRAFYAWYICQPGAKAPRRPSAQEWLDRGHAGLLLPCEKCADQPCQIDQ